MDYYAMAERYRPNQVDVLLIAESPPQPVSLDIKQIPYFYNTNFVNNKRDALLRETAKVILSCHVAIRSEEQKHQVLSRLKDKDFFLIDAVEYPVNKMAKRERREAIHLGIEKLIVRVEDLKPKRIIIALASLYDVTCPTKIV